METTSASSSSTVVVTGGNSGVGYAICKSLIDERTGDLDLVLACRSWKRGEEARRRLELTDKGDGLRISVILLDLADIKSTLSFCQEIKRRYSSIDALCLNAGYIDLDHIDWTKALVECLVDFRKAMTYPEFKVQRRGRISADGYGLVWQTNVFGHFVLYKELKGLVKRVIWTSSIEARRSFYDRNDVECVKTRKPYDVSKYQIDLIHLALAQESERSERNESGSTGSRPPTSYLADPGISITNVVPLNPILVFFQMLSFYFIRLLGSRFHLMDPISSATALVKLVISDDDQIDPLVKYGSRSTRWGETYIENGKVDDQGQGAEEDAEALLEEFEKKYQAIRETGKELRLRGGASTDIWGEDESVLAENEFRRLKEDFTNQGYREGITKGEAETLQEGFDQGYLEVGPMAMKIGGMRGQVAALMSISKREKNLGLEEMARLVLAQLNGIKRSDLKENLEVLTNIQKVIDSMIKEI